MKLNWYFVFNNHQLKGQSGNATRINWRVREKTNSFCLQKTCLLVLMWTDSKNPKRNKDLVFQLFESILAVIFATIWLIKWTLCYSKMMFKVGLLFGTACWSPSLPKLVLTDISGNVMSCLILLISWKNCISPAQKFNHHAFFVVARYTFYLNGW